METNYRQFQSSPHAFHFTSTIHPTYSCPPYPSRTATIHSSIQPLLHSIVHPLLIHSTTPLTQTHLLPNYQLYTPFLHSIQFTSPSLHPFNTPLHIHQRSLSIRSSPPASPFPNRHPSIHYPNNPMHLLAILFKYPYEGLQHFSPYAKLIFHQQPIFEPHAGHTPTIPYTASYPSFFSPFTQSLQSLCNSSTLLLPSSALHQHTFNRHRLILVFNKQPNSMLIHILHPLHIHSTLHMQHLLIPVINEFQHITQYTDIVSVLQVHPQYHPFPKHSHHDHGQEEALDTLPLPIDRRRNIESNGPKCPKRVSMNVHVPFCDSGHSGLFTPSSWGTAKTPVQHTLSAMRPLLVDIP